MVRAAVLDLTDQIAAELAEPDEPLPAVAVDADRARRIRAAVRARSTELRMTHPILRHQSFFGALALGVAAAGFGASAAGYLTGVLPWWATAIVSAFFLSIAHEVEHDTIHRLYFRNHRWAQDLLLAGAWLLRPYTASPWARREVHLLHHRASGTTADLEERVISNGMRWSPFRLLVMVDLVVASTRQLVVQRNRFAELSRFAVKAFFPLTYLAFALWYGFLIVHLGNACTGGAFASGAWVGRLDAAVVVWIVPNLLRVACLHFVSSNIHYYGDVGSGNVVEQTQVLTHPVFWPIQALCMNFGGTHGIHHFVANDPFYVRQLTAPAAHRVMRENGVRFNDLRTFLRANRLGDETEAGELFA